MTPNSHDHSQSQDANQPNDIETSFKDVWTRSGSTYRVRATVLLLINMLLFAGVGNFAFWLRTGEWFAPVLQGYGDALRQTFLSVRVAGYSGVSLGKLLLEPISVQDVPLQIPIIGLLMASLISIPILVSILYRFWAAIPFVAVVGFLAVMPWLAITLLGSCLIASVKPFRTRFRFMSALLALIPVAAYMILAWSGTTDDVVGRIDPIDRIKFVAPWVLAIVAAAIAFALVLSIAKIVDYRPGAIAPLLAIMFGLPVAMFETYVGRDELYYRRLERTQAGYFADCDASQPLDQAAAEAWARRPVPRASLQAIREVMEAQWLLGLASDISPFESALAQYQSELVAQCDWFLRNFPDSRYAPNAIFIKARALDTRVDPDEFRRTKWVRYYDDFPSTASSAAWEMLLANSPNTLLGAVAILRLAQLEARDGEVDHAVGRLKTLIRRFDERRPGESAHETSGDPLKSVMTRDHPETTLEISLKGVLLEAHRLHGLLTENRRDPLWGDEPLCGTRRSKDDLRFGMLDLVPRHSRYVENLQKIKKRYPNCLVADNIDLESAKVTSDSALRIQRLKQCLDQYANGDAAPETLFHLANAYRQSDNLVAAEKVLARLLSQYPDSFWTRQVRGNTHRQGDLQFTKAQP